MMIICFQSNRRKMSIFLAALLILAGTVPAFAHKVNVYAYVEGDTVHVTGYFSKGKAKNSRILVTLPDGSTLLEGRTDNDGKFSFRATVRAELKIQIFAGEGHMSSYTLKAEELPESLPAPDSP